MSRTTFQSVILFLDGRLTTDTRTDYTGGSVVSSRNSNSQESVHSLNTEQRRQPSHDLDILVPQSGDLPMVDSQDIEDFFSGIENELSQRPTGLISDPLLSSVGVHVTPNPVPQRPPPPPYSSAARAQYPREIHSHAWSTVSVGEPPPYQAPQQERVQTNLDMVHAAANGARVEPEFEHINDDFGPRRPRPESPRADSHRQLLKWQEDEKLGAMATISPVLYANLNYPNLRDEYPGICDVAFGSTLLLESMIMSKNTIFFATVPLGYTIPQQNNNGATVFDNYSLPVIINLTIHSFLLQNGYRGIERWQDCGES